jgi:hypothetical protein
MSTAQASAVRRRFQPVSVGPAGEAEAGQARNDQVEGILGRTTVGFGVGERRDRVPELQNRAGPSVGEQQRAGTGHARLDVQEVDLQAVDGGRELAPAVQQRLGFAPVVLGAPVLHEPLHFRELRALRGVAHGLPVGPTGVQ